VDWPDADIEANKKTLIATTTAVSKTLGQIRIDDFSLSEHELQNVINPMIPVPTVTTLASKSSIREESPLQELMQLVMMRENYCRLSAFVKESVERACWSVPCGTDYEGEQAQTIQESQELACSRLPMK
jgi:hypothetical protein